MAMVAVPVQLGEADSIVHGPNSSLREVIRAAKRIAPTQATVLLTGETGTGKEVFARLIHRASGRAAGALVPVNCGAIPEALLESELFGHVKGAFTGAMTSRRGRLAAAEGGTLFLDEIGELSLGLQVKLLRVLQEKVYEPVGSSESVRADFRLVAATNRDLAAEVAAGRFRRDLFYRLNICPLHLPPLRERAEDVAVLFFHFWRMRGETRPVDPAVIRILERYDWPGNVRELENLVERLSVCTEAPTITPGDLPPPFAATPPPAVRLVTLPSTQTALVPQELELPVNLPELLRTIEERYIAAALDRAQGNKKAAAELLGLQRTTLVEKLRRNGARTTPLTES